EMMMENYTNQKKQNEHALKRFSGEYPKYYSLEKISLMKIKDLELQIIAAIEELSKNIINAETQLTDLDKKIEKVNNEMDQVRYHYSNEKVAYQIKLVINAKEEGQFLIDLSYIVDNAWWEPFYDIFIHEEETSAEKKDAVKNIELNLMANVNNRTGVDWNNIELEISTATITPVKMIKPEPYQIDEAPIENLKMLAAKRKRSGLAMAHRDVAFQMAAPPMPMAMEAEGVEFEQEFEKEPELDRVESDISMNFGVQTYRLKSRFDIPSGKNPVPVPLLTEELSSIKQYFWSVSTPEKVLCNNKIRNQNLIILPGKAKIYVDDEFIGETKLELIAPNEEFKIGERITYDVKVTKKLKAKEKQKEGAFKGKLSSTYSYEIKIKNLAQVKEELILYDRIPYSISEKIKVKIEEISDEPNVNEMNVLKFVIPLKEIKETKVISYRYSVIYEKNIKITPPLP
ncbi:MAG: DUF4139 domain-containing protein, partial [Promethearchaeota archaeon]